MKEINSWSDTAHLQPKFLNKKSCAKYIKLAKNPSLDVRKRCSITYEFWDDRTVNIDQDPLVLQVKKFLDKKFNLNLQITRAQIQTWMDGTFALLHHHKNDVATWNTVIYLNNNFEGGHFYSSNGLVIKPEPGLLTFFNGQKVLHGVGQVKGNDRFTLIFWWKE